MAEKPMTRPMEIPSGRPTEETDAIGRPTKSFGPEMTEKLPEPTSEEESQVDMLLGTLLDFVWGDGYEEIVKRMKGDMIPAHNGRVAITLEISPTSPGWLFFGRAIFQVWRGRIPEKWSKNGPFPLGGDCLERRDRYSTTGRRGFDHRSPITNSVLSQASHRIRIKRATDKRPFAVPSFSEIAIRGLERSGN